MAKLVVFLEGTEISQTELIPEKEYILGRSRTCDINLDHPEISRQHAKLIFNADQWSCEVMSQYGRMQCHGQPVDKIIFVEDTTFTIIPFQLHFETDAKDSSDATCELAKDPDTVVTDVISLASRLQRISKTGDVIEEFALKTGSIQAGRSSSCQIKLKDSKASRKHFELRIVEGNCTIVGLESRTKTFVNGKAIQSQVLQSGDEIQVGQDKFRYVLVSPVFESLAPFSIDLSENTQPIIKLPPMVQIPGQDMVQSGQPSFSATLRQKGRTLTVGLLALGLVFVIFQLTKSEEGNEVADNSKPSVDRAPATPGKERHSTSFDKLPVDQKKFIEETYNLALNLYMKGQYDLAALELSKIFKQIPEYKDSRNLMAYSQQGIESKKQKDNADRIKREQIDLQRKVSDILDRCENLLRANKFGEVENCVNYISDLDPDNERGQMLVERAQNTQLQLKMNNKARADAARRKLIAQKNYQLAQAEMSQQKYTAAIAHLNQIANLSFEDREGLKKKAKNLMQAAREKMAAQGIGLFKSGKSALEAKDYKTAISHFDRALASVPNNFEINKYKEKAEKELHLEMKNLYAESVIEENLGNIESAKKKWQTILEQDIKTDSYYEKARIKLGKYEK